MIEQTNTKKPIIGFDCKSKPFYGFVNRKISEFGFMDFRDRLETVAAGRKLTVWAKSLGLSSGTASRLSKGIAPGPEQLIPILKSENVSITWLLEGRGAPYIVSQCVTAEDMFETLETLVVDEPEDWQVYALGDGDNGVVILTQPGKYVAGNQEIDYTILEIISGPFGEDIMGFFAEHKALVDRRSVEDIKRLRTGHVGNPELFGWLKECKKMEGQHIVDDREGAELDSLIQNYIALPPEQRHAVREVIASYKVRKLSNE